MKVDWDTDMVDWDTDMVDLNRRKSRPIRSTGEFKFSYLLYKYKMVAAVSPTNGKKKKEDDKKKKLTKVLSTKLSSEDYNVFRILTNHAYRMGEITQDSP